MEKRSGRIHGDGRRKLGRRFVSQVQIGQPDVTRTLLPDKNHSLICFPVCADLCAASRISTTIMFASSDERPAGLTSLRTTAARYEIGSAFTPVIDCGMISVSRDIFAVRTRNRFG